MTGLQAEYSKIAEQRRHNLATERAATRDIELSAKQIAETQRHNERTEVLSERDLLERIRHQKAQDAETLRHNGATEAEIYRHNQATEALTRADNTLRESIARMQDATNRWATAAKLENESKLKQAELDYKREADQLNRDLTEWKTKLDNAIDQRQTDISEARLLIDNKKINAEIDRLAAQTQNDIDTLLYKYDSNWAATKQKYLRALQTGGAMTVDKLKNFNTDYLGSQLGGVLNMMIDTAMPFHVNEWLNDPSQIAEDLFNGSVFGKVTKLSKAVFGK